MITGISFLDSDNRNLQNGLFVGPRREVCFHWIASLFVFTALFSPGCSLGTVKMREVTEKSFDWKRDYNALKFG